MIIYITKGLLFNAQDKEFFFGHFAVRSEN